MSADRVVAIDGPGGSGKTTLARRLAACLELPFLDTGLIYRAVALRLLDEGAALGDEQAACAAARSLQESDLSRSDLGHEQVGEGASVVAAMPSVRAALLDMQKHFAADPRGAVLCGRDTGTVVCPDARVKLFVTASVEERARRRLSQLRERGMPAIYERVLAELQARDLRDRTRKIAPLRPAEDACVLDTTELDAEAAYRVAYAFVRQAFDDAGTEPSRRVSGR